MRTSSRRDGPCRALRGSCARACPDGAPRALRLRRCRPALGRRGRCGRSSAPGRSPTSRATSPRAACLRPRAEDRRRRRHSTRRTRHQPERRARQLHGRAAVREAIKGSSARAARGHRRSARRSRSCNDAAGPRGCASSLSNESIVISCSHGASDHQGAGYATRSGPTLGVMSHRVPADATAAR